MAAVLQQASLLGTPLSTCLQRPQRPQKRRTFGPVVAGTWRKVNKIDDGWKKVDKHQALAQCLTCNCIWLHCHTATAALCYMGMQGFWGSGYFNEGNASPDNNYLKRIEAKKLLSTIEKSGLLSKADKAGLTLSRVCRSFVVSASATWLEWACNHALLVVDRAVQAVIDS